MNLYIEHDAATLARMIGRTPPHCDGLIVKHGDPANVLAATLRRANPFNASHHWLVDLDLPGERVVAWSGTLAEDLFAAEPRTWMRPGREAFERFCNDIAPQLSAHGRKLCFLPHSRHVLSDVQSCVDFLRRHEGGPFEIALSPATMLEPSMLRDSQDHLRRMFETLAPIAAIVMLSDVRIVMDDKGEPFCKPVPLGGSGGEAGALPREAMLQLLEAHVPRHLPVVIGADQIEVQLSWLRADASRS